MAKQKERKVGIYARLSKEDARAGESVSIENQKLLLTKHVKDNGWELVEIYCDDGFSGTNQNRPALQRMFADVRQGLINTVLIKDLSRLGRNYLEVGNLSEVFLPQHGCELISLNEKLDEMAVFRNWFNEQHSRETSKKVKAVKKMYAKDGKFIGAFEPYGYIKAEGNKHKLVPDETAANVVRKIYEMRSEGMGYNLIARRLNDEGITAPRDHYYQRRNMKNPHRVNHCWCSVTVREILASQAYIGNLVQGKYGSASYKSHKLVDKPEDEWIYAEGTHEPLVSVELWERVRDMAEKRRRPRVNKVGELNMFSGLLQCADCGCKMRHTTQRKVRKNGNLYEYTNFTCGSYSRSGGRACSTHTIGEDALRMLVVEQIRAHARLVACDEGRIIDRILKAQNAETENGKATFAAELTSNKKRLDMLVRLIDKLYEDRLTGTVPEATFKTLIQKYEGERVEKTQAVANLEKRIQGMKDSVSDTAKWTGLIKKYVGIESLDAQTLVALIDRVEIGDAKEANGLQARDVKIVYKYVGDMSWLEFSAEANDTEGRAAVYGEAV